MELELAKKKKKKKTNSKVGKRKLVKGVVIYAINLFFINNTKIHKENESSHETNVVYI